MASEIVITGIGLVTPLGATPAEVLQRIETGVCAATPHKLGAHGGLPCPLWAPIRDFDAQAYVPEPKTIRLMSRESLLAVAAARCALHDAGVEIGKDYPADEVALFGATGLAGVPLAEVSRLIEFAADETGELDLRRFGATALKQVRPVLSFKILSNMPLCFVSIFEGIEGANAVYNPWEGQGAQAIASGIQAIRQGDAACALVGGCDVKTHELGLIALVQWGVLHSWSKSGSGCVPGEGAVFLVLEEQQQAAARGARVYARVRDFHLGTIRCQEDRQSRYEAILRMLVCGEVGATVAAGDGDELLREAEDRALRNVGVKSGQVLHPKAQAGNLFAAAAALQVGLAATLVEQGRVQGRVLANCFGYGSEQGAFLLEGL